MEFSWLSTARGFALGHRARRDGVRHTRRSTELLRNAVRRPAAPPSIRAAAGQPLRRSEPVLFRRAAGLRPFLRRRRRSGRLLRAAVRRALFPDAAPRQREPGRSSATRSARQPRRRCSTAARSTTPMRATARAMPISTTRSSTARRSSRAAPATARIRSVSRASTSRPIRPCGRATSWRPATTSRRR